MAIDDDNQFRAALRSLDIRGQRVAAARFVENVLPLCADNDIIQVVRIAKNKNASRMDLAAALKTAKTSVLRNHTRYGSEGDWRKQAGYFVARAAVAALSPKCQLPEGIAWHAALSSRLARTSEAIGNNDLNDLNDITDEQERTKQFNILAGLLTS
jgi:hypothetical protein